MDLELIARFLERAIASLELDAPMHPWWLGEVRPRRTVRLSRLLASPCPLPYDLEPDRLFEAFLPEDRDAVANQIDDGYRHLISLTDEPPKPVDDASVVDVQLSVPLFGRDRVLLRIRTRNLYGDNRTVTGDFHAWLDPAGTPREALSQPEQDLASKHRWERWVVGLSPGLSA